MYNRYVPQPDGSFQRSYVPDPPPEPPRPTPPPPKPAPPTPPPPPHPNGNILDYFRNMLPPNFDTGDLIVVLLLLLLAGDCAQERSTAMLTLVLYLFL